MDQINGKRQKIGAEIGTGTGRKSVVVGDEDEEQDEDEADDDTEQLVVTTSLRRVIAMHAPALIRRRQSRKHKVNYLK